MGEDLLTKEQLDHVIKIYDTVSPFLGEAGKRLFLAAASKESQYGSTSYLAENTDLSRKAIERGIQELENDHVAETYNGRQRHSGGGRKSFLEKNPGALDILRCILEDNTYGDPTRILSWTNLSLSEIKSILNTEYGYDISRPTVAELLEILGYSRQENKKMIQVGASHPKRDSQFTLINEMVPIFQEYNYPIISVDTKKKEPLGNLKNPGTSYRPKGKPLLVEDHDFPDPIKGKINPYGIYDIQKNMGFVNIGNSNDTAEFAVESIRRWWYTMGHRNYPNATKIYITCDGGGSNGSRNRLWKYSLARLAEETGLEIWVSHFPPGTSKWNKIEHRLWCHISRSWQAQPLKTADIALELIKSTTTRAGLKVDARIDDNEYPAGEKISDRTYSTIKFEYFGNNTKWNYIISGFEPTLFDTMCDENSEKTTSEEFE